MSDWSYEGQPATPAAEIYKFFLYLNNKPGLPTGVYNIVTIGQNVIGKLPPTLIQYAITVQIALYGGYPDRGDIAPCAALIAGYTIVGILHSVIFSINCSRGHYFWISLAWVTYCIFKIVGMGLRLSWARDVTQIKLGLTTEFFLIVPTIILVSFNLILAQRLFTWRHPVGGSTKLFWSFMLGTYAFTVVLVGLAALASFVPYLNFIELSSFQKWQNLNKVISVIVILYSLTSVSLLALSYWSPTKLDENLYTFQPWWIESFGTFYFVKKNAAQEAEETFVKRNSNHRHAVRVIAATQHHHNMVEGLSTDRGDLTHNLSMGLLIFSTLAIVVSSIFRCITIFVGRLDGKKLSLSSSTSMYITWGFLEWLVNVAYIIWRVDLRFYRPDILPKKIRSIITAEQTGRTSRQYSVEEEKEEYESDIEIIDDELNFHDENIESENEYKTYSESYTNSESYEDLPYPHEKKAVDNDSEFRF